MNLSDKSAGNVPLNDNRTYEYVNHTFESFADTIIPRSPELSEEYGKIQYYGALDAYTDEYLVISLNSLFVPMATATALILNMAAEQFLLASENHTTYESNSAWTFFSALSPVEQLQATGLLLQPQVMMPFSNQPGIREQDIYAIILSLVRMTMMGYYSEWSGYGTTRLASPNQRVLEFTPISWRQIGYPGPSQGYRYSKSYNFV